jgi:uncharacterized membrane protein YvbJ
VIIHNSFRFVISFYLVTAAFAQSGNERSNIENTVAIIHQSITKQDSNYFYSLLHSDYKQQLSKSDAASLISSINSEFGRLIKVNKVEYTAEPEDVNMYRVAVSCTYSSIDALELLTLMKDGHEYKLRKHYMVKVARPPFAPK